MKRLILSLAFCCIPFASGIHVSGNLLIDDSTGKQVVLQGVSHSGTEYGCV
jgi:hypothetical protein